MNYGILALTLVAGLFVAGLYRGLNISIWRRRLERRIGEVPSEAPVPWAVESGCHPLGWYLLGVFILGVVLVRFAPTFGAILAGVPAAILIALILSSALGSGARTKDDVREKISRLSERIDAAGQEDAALAPYLRYWRSQLGFSLLPRPVANREVLQAALAERAFERIEEDLEQVENDRHADVGLRKRAADLASSVVHLRKEVEGEAAKQTAIEALGSRYKRLRGFGWALTILGGVFFVGFLTAATDPVADEPGPLYLALAAASIVLLAGLECLRRARRLRRG